MINDLDFQKSLIGGKGTYMNTQRVWKIDSLVVNDTVVVLTNSQKLFTKTYLSNGTFIDKDGIAGNWDISPLDNLKEIILDTNGRYHFDSLNYHINLISSNRLVYTLNSIKKIKYIYVVSE
ncbi:MAG: hypothetical protein WCP61_07550 [Chitinophagia bacterium]